MEKENQVINSEITCDRCKEDAGQDMQNRFNIDTLCEKHREEFEKATGRKISDLKLDASSASVAGNSTLTPEEAEAQEQQRMQAPRCPYCGIQPMLPTFCDSEVGRSPTSIEMLRVTICTSCRSVLGTQSLFKQSQVLAGGMGTKLPPPPGKKLFNM